MASTGLWPGFCPDADERWQRAHRRRSAEGGHRTTRRRERNEQATVGDETYPAAARATNNSPSTRISAALKRQAARVGDDGLTPAERANRDVLANGEQSSKPGVHVLGHALRFVRQGRQTFLDYIQRAFRNGDPDAKAWWSIYADLSPAQQGRVDFDDICEAAGVAPDRIMSVVVSQAMRLGTDVGDLVAATMHPRLVDRTVKSAMRIGGDYAAVAQKDREFLFQHQRFIPTPRGTTVTVHASAQAAAAAANVPSVPSFAESVTGASQAQHDVQRDIIEGETVDRQALPPADTFF